MEKSDKSNDKQLNKAIGLGERVNGLLRAIAIVAIVTAMLLLAFSCLFRMAIVPTTSMEPTIQKDSVVVYWKLSYTLGSPEPKRGDVISFYDASEGTTVVKRVVAIAGDHVEFKNDMVYVNGTDIGNGFCLNADDMVTAPGYATEYDVPEGTCFVLGDNRGHSRDSRFMEDPFIKYSDIRGTMLFSFKDSLGLFEEKSAVAFK